MIVEAAVLAGALAAIGLVAGYTLKTGTPPTPSSPRVRAVALAMVPDAIDGDILELGAGWGGLAFALAARCRGHRVVGYECSPLPWLVGRLRRALFGPSNLDLRWRDFRKVRLDGGGLVVCYLFPDLMADLRDKLEAELAAGTPVLAISFAMPGWHPVETRRAGDLYRSPVYLYRVPAPSASGRVT